MTTKIKVPPAARKAIRLLEVRLEKVDAVLSTWNRKTSAYQAASGKVEVTRQLIEEAKAGSYRCQALIKSMTGPVILGTSVIWSFSK